MRASSTPKAELPTRRQYDNPVRRNPAFVTIDQIRMDALEAAEAIIWAMGLIVSALGGGPPPATPIRAGNHR
jgi:hypothetical protein